MGRRFPKVSESARSSLAKGFQARCPSRPTGFRQWNGIPVRPATIVELAGEIKQPVLVKVHGAGLDLDAFHLVIAAADNAHADVVVEHDGDARLAEGVEIITGKYSTYPPHSFRSGIPDPSMSATIVFA